MGKTDILLHIRSSSLRSRNEERKKEKGCGIVPAPYGEVIQPQLPLRLPCYDFWLLRALRFDPTRWIRPQHLTPRLQRRAVCTKSMAVFTGT